MDVTSVPVVSATLTARTYKEFGADFPHDTERLTADSGKPDTDGYPTGRVPLSVPDGVLSWIELA